MHEIVHCVSQQGLAEKPPKALLKSCFVQKPGKWAEILRFIFYLKSLAGDFNERRMNDEKA